MQIIKAHAVKNLCYIAAQKMVPKGIVVHSTGANNPFLKRYVDCPEKLGVNKYGNHWNNPKPDGREVCVHAFIGYDKDKNISVAEILPLNICCWGVGRGSKGSYNYNPAYIQFEICEDSLADKSYYRRAFAVAVDYAAHLCKLYNIKVDKIVGHNEAYKMGYGSNHGDPEHWMKKFGESMGDFRDAVSKKLDVAVELSVSEKTLQQTFSDGDLVSIANNATYYSGKKVPDWVVRQNWYIKGTPKGNRVIIDENESGTNSICSPINKKFLTVVKAATTVNFKPYLVKVTANSLNIRSGAGVDNSIVGCITDKGTYTIVAEKDGKGANKWGKLKSGMGWISLDYTVKRD